MNEHDHSNRLIWGIIIVAVLSFGSFGLVWSTGGPLPSKALAAVPAKAKAEASPAPHADAVAVAGLEKRVLHLEDTMKAPPTFDTSQLEARLKGLESQLASVQTQLGARASDLDALKTKMDSAGAAKANPESVKTTIDALQTDLGNLHTRFDQLSEQVASATASDHKHSTQKSHHSKSRSRD